MLSKVKFKFQKLLNRKSIKKLLSEDRRKHLQNKQVELFSSNALDRSGAVKRLNEVCSTVFKKNYDENDGMFSEHLVILTGLSLMRKDEPLKILEIGTFDGRTAVLLSKLFPQAEITTIDLPENDQDFSATYNRSENHNEFVRERNNRLSSVSNVKFQAINSLELSIWPANSFDLIWIDGAHGYPVACADIINAYKLLNHKGIALLDDVWTYRQTNDPVYSSIASFETLKALKDAKLISDFTLFLKRLSPEHNFDLSFLNTQKFVGMFLKN